MEYLNFLGTRQEVTRDELQTMLVLLAPLTPYVTEELWERLGNLQSIHCAPWLTYEAEACVLTLSRFPSRSMVACVIILKYNLMLQRMRSNSKLW